MGRDAENMDDNKPDSSLAEIEAMGGTPYYEPQTIAEMDARGIAHLGCGPCPRCAGKDHCESLIGGPGEADYAPFPPAEQK